MVLVADRSRCHCKETMMKTSFELTAEFRDDQGKGASRRLRHAGRVPAILYGGKREPRALSLDHTRLRLALDNEKFYSSIMQLKVGDQTQAAILRDVQRHPWKNQIVHVDLQRVFEDETIRLSVPLHYKGEEAAPGVKTEGGMMSHLRNELVVECLPKDLPEFLEVDVSGLHLNQSLHLSDIKLPAGVVSVELVGGSNPSIVAVHTMRAEEIEAPVAAVAEGAAVAAAAPGVAPTAAAPAVPGDKKAAAPAVPGDKTAAAPAVPGDKKAAEPAKKEEPKKEAAKKDAPKKDAKK
jgi:large subunit ribosomal protein L25